MDQRDDPGRVTSPNWCSVDVPATLERADHEKLVGRILEDAKAHKGRADPVEWDGGTAIYVEFDNALDALAFKLTSDHVSGCGVAE